jgi:hypothetical protein
VRQMPGREFHREGAYLMVIDERGLTQTSRTIIVGLIGDVLPDAMLTSLIGRVDSMFQSERWFRLGKPSTWGLVGRFLTRLEVIYWIRMTVVDAEGREISVRSAMANQVSSSDPRAGCGACLP